MFGSFRRLWHLDLVSQTLNNQLTINNQNLLQQKMTLEPIPNFGQIDCCSFVQRDYGK